MEEGERYLGGFCSPLQLTLTSGVVGAGIYVTDKKLVLARKGMNLDKKLNALVTGYWRKDFLPSTLTEDQNHAIVNELSASPNLLVLRKDHISIMVMREPPGIFRTGFLEIHLTSGEPVRLIIGKKKEYRYIFSLLKLFNPQALKEVWELSVPKGSSQFD